VSKEWATTILEKTAAAAEEVEAAEEPFYSESKTKEGFRATQLND
jgi:hypothetical protein